MEEQKLRRRPESWRLACQTLVNRSVLVLTRPQVGLPDRERLLAQASQRALARGAHRLARPARADRSARGDPNG